MLHPINETFSEEEWKILKPIKLKSGLNWHDFILRISTELGRIDRQDNKSKEDN